MKKRTKKPYDRDNDSSPHPKQSDNASLVDHRGVLLRVSNANINADGRFDYPKSAHIIDAYAFKGCTHLTHVQLPEGLEHIWNCAFRDCINLDHIYLPEALLQRYTIGFY